MTRFATTAVAENFGGWVDSLASLTDCTLHRGHNLSWFNSSLPHPMYNYGYNLTGEQTSDLAKCIKSFVDTKTPFYFCNGIWHEGKSTPEIITNLGADSFGNLDGMFFDLTQDLPKAQVSVDLELKPVEGQAEYMNFAKAIGLASEQPLEIGNRFFSNFAKLKESPFRLFTAYVDDKPVGCSMIFMPEGEVAGNYYDWVIPEYRKKGINSAMVVERLKTAKEAGYKYLVAQCMGTSMRLYSALSFQKVCELDFYGKANY